MFLNRPFRRYLTALSPAIIVASLWLANCWLLHHFTQLCQPMTDTLPNCSTYSLYLLNWANNLQLWLVLILNLAALLSCWLALRVLVERLERPKDSSPH